MLLIACNCCFFNYNEQLYYRDGKQLYQDCRDYLTRQKLWPTWAEGCIEREALVRINESFEKTEFDTVNLDELSEKTLRDLAEKMSIADSSTTRERMNTEQLIRGGEFLRERCKIK